MWLDELKQGESWMGVWKERFSCSKCGGIIKDLKCPICEHDHTPGTVHKGVKYGLPQLTLMGAIEWTTYLLLELMQREWERPVIEYEPNTHKMSVPQKIMIVILFWSLFETLMDRLFTRAFKDLPVNISTDLMKRYSSIGSRMNQLYKMAFSESFKEDLKSVGYFNLYDHLINIQEKRNEFIHGRPEAIDEKTIDDTILYLQETQLAWIAIYNKRCTKLPDRN